MAIINEGKKILRIKKCIRMINNQRSNRQKIGIDEIIKHNETINNSLKSKI